MRAIRELGLLNNREVEHNGSRVIPRKFFIEQVTPFLSVDGGGDIVIARVDVTGRRNGRVRRIRYQLLDRHDPVTGITAMSRTTGYSLAITALMQARGQVRPGVGTPDEAVPHGPYIEELRKRGIHVELRLDDRSATRGTP